MKIIVLICALIALSGCKNKDVFDILNPKSGGHVSMGYILTHPTTTRA